jgi:hypothetical protein
MAALIATTTRHTRNRIRDAGRMSALPSMSAIPSTGRSPMISARRLLLNLTSNVLSFGISVLVGIWLTPYLIRRLGVGAYGLIPLTTSVTSYLAIFTVALNSAVGRFRTRALFEANSWQARSSPCSGEPVWFV